MRKYFRNIVVWFFNDGFFVADRLSMKVLTVVSVAIVVVDLEVLRKTFVEYF